MINQLSAGKDTLVQPDIPADNDQRHKISVKTRRKILDRLQEQTTPRPLSLTIYINGRRRLRYNYSPEVVKDERDVRISLRAAHLKSDNADKDSIGQMQTLLNKQWNQSKGYYLRYHARGVIVTAATAMARILRGFPPAHIVVDEGSQLAEHATVAVISRFYEMACKVSIVGDPKQNQVFNASDDEFSRTIKHAIDDGRGGRQRVQVRDSRPGDSGWQAVPTAVCCGYAQDVRRVVEGADRAFDRRERGYVPVTACRQRPYELEMAH